MKEQILALAVQSGFKLDWAILNCTGQFESFYHAAIESYKAELLKEVGEPVAEFKRHPFGDYTELSFSAGYSARRGDKLYTSDQVAAAILKATKPLEEEMSELKIYKAAYRMAAREMTGSDEPVELALEISQLRAKLAAAQKEVERLKTVPMKYRRMAFNAQLQDENNELRARLAKAEQQVAEWQPIETAPKDGAWIVVTSTHNKYYRASVQFYDGHWYDTREVTHDDLMEDAATHWMPMLKAPNDKIPPPSP